MRAARPPSPASISSKQTLGVPALPPRPVSASITRESSPPDAASRSGAGSIPGLVAIMKVTVSAPDWPNPPVAGSSTTSSRAPGIASSSSSSATRFSSLRAARLRDAVERGGGLGAATLGRGEPRAQLGAPPLGVIEALDLAAAMLAVREHRLDRATVLSLQAVKQLEALLDRGQAARVGLHPLCIGAQLCRDV